MSAPLHCGAADHEPPLKFDFEKSVGEAGGLPMYLALSGGLSDPGETLLKLRALQCFDRGAARYAIHRTVRCGAPAGSG
jgi:hypothetical protein